MTSRIRKRVKEVHFWNKEIELWTSAQIRRNLWRFDKIYEFEDVMQEARILFFKIQKKYSHITEPAHFYTLFRTSLKRMIIDKARKRRRSIVYDPATSAEEIFAGMTEYNSGHLALILEELPSELKIVLRALTTGRLRLKLDRPTKKLRHRENANMRLRRKYNLSTEDPIGELKAYLSNT